MRYTVSGLRIGNELSLITDDPPLSFENIADAQFKINESRDNLRRDCWRWEINFITFALRSRHYPRLRHQPITAGRAVYIIIAEVAISRSPLRRSIMVNPAAARNNKGSSDITGDGVLVIIGRTGVRRKRKRSSRAFHPPPAATRANARGKRGGWIRWFF